VLGSGFDAGSRVDFLLDGLADAKVRTNSTRYVSSKELVASITIDAEAVPDFRDVAVTTSTGKKGIGTERFQVLAIEELAAPVGGSLAYDLNGTGLVVGQVVGGCAGPHPAYWTSPEVWVLLPLPSGTCGGRVFGVSASGYITGFTSLGDGTWSATRWAPTASGYVAEFLGFAPDGGRYEALGVNDLGHVVAGKSSGGGYAAWRATWWSPETGWVDLALPPGAEGCYGMGISQSDAVVGYCRINSVFSATFWAGPYASPVVLPRLSGWNSSQSGVAINESGVIAGYAWNRSRSGSITETAVRWFLQGGTWVVESLGHLGGGVSSANDVNDDGQIVGWSRKTSNGNNVAFLWTPGAGMRALGGLTPASKSTASGITNSTGGNGVIIAGWSETQGVNRAVIWRP